MVGRNIAVDLVQRTFIINEQIENFGETNQKGLQIQECTLLSPCNAFEVRAGAILKKPFY